MLDIEKTVDEAFSASMPYDCWEKLKGESGKAYAAFCVFRDMDAANRSIKKAFEISCKESSYKQWCNYSAQFKWSERVAAFDRYKEKLKLTELRKSIEALGEKQREVAGKMLDVMSIKLATMEPNDLPFAVMSDWVTTTTKVQRETVELFLGNDKSEMKQGEFSFEPEFKGL